MKKMVTTIIVLLMTCVLNVGVSLAYPPGYSFEEIGTGFAGPSNDQYVSPSTSVRMGTIANTDRGNIVFNGGPTLGTINQLSYHTYTVGAGTEGQLTAWVAIYLHTQPGKTFAEWSTDYFAASPDVFYIQAEPVYTTGNPVLNTWQMQDAFGTNALKWISLEGPDAPYSAPTLTDYIAETAGTFATREYGSLYVVAIKIRMGSGGPWVNTLAYVDDVTIGDYFEDFEPAPPAPLAMKQQAIADLQGLLPTGNANDDERINKAIKDLNDSIKPGLWTDPWHVTKKVVFDEEQRSVAGLMRVTTVDVSAVIDTIVEADRELAQTLVDDAVAAGGKAGEIAKANTELAKGDADAAVGKFDKAIDHYGNAWDHARKAM